MSTFVSSGDGGSTPDDTGTGNEDAGPLQVEYYSSDPSVTGVGGTTLRVNSSDARTSETAWSGSGGGVSIQFAKPGWQTGTGVPSGTKRFVPDVAMPADPNTGAYVYLGGSAQTIGGTSWAAPTWAGFCALINEARANAGKTGGMGLLNPSLYPLIGTANFYDVTSGNNAEGSKAGGKYPTTAGYDEVTGIGTPDVGVLIKTLAGAAIARRPSPAPTPTPFDPTPTAHARHRQVASSSARFTVGAAPPARLTPTISSSFSTHLGPRGSRQVFRAIRQRGRQGVECDQVDRQPRGGTLLSDLGKGWLGRQSPARL